MLSQFPDANPNPVMRITTEGEVIYHNQASNPLLESWEFSEGFLHSKKLLTLLKPLGSNPRKIQLDIKVFEIIYSVSLVPIENTSFLNVYALDITEREKATQELIQSQSKYYELFNNMLDGYAYHKIITDSQGIPIDYEFIDINPAFTTLTEITREMCIGKRVTEVLPTIREDPFDWIGIYGEVALNGTSITFESHAVPLQKYFSVFVYQSESNHFVTVFRDITESVKAEEEVKKARSKIKVLSGLLPICASCKKIRDEGGNWNILETYIDGHSEAKFTHGICPECAEKLLLDK